jgi:hypothetical protein
MRLLLTLAGFAISFVLPTFAQQKDGVDQEQRQVADSLAIKLDEAWTRQRRFTNACRNDGAVSTVSTLALMVLYAVSDLWPSLESGPTAKCPRCAAWSPD